jgi:hypothetical protein
MKTIAFFGGSNLIGGGYPDGINCPDIYTNIIASQGYSTKNYGIPGASSYEIFLSCMHELIQPPADIIFVEWNMFPRHKFQPAPDITIKVSGSNIIVPDTGTHCISIPKKQIENFHKTLLLLDGDYARILTLLTYCEIIQDVCRLKNLELVMINGNVPWTLDLFETYNDQSDLDQSLGKYSKELLDFDNRDDAEIRKLLCELKEKFDRLDQDRWPWIFENLWTLKVDHAPLDQHPGPKTMKIVADRVIDFLKKKNL